MICPSCHKRIPDEAAFCPSCGSSVAPPPLSGKGRGRPGGATLALALLFFALAFLFQIFGFFAGYALGLDGDFSSTAGMAVGAFLGIVVLGGQRLLKPSASSLMRAVRTGWWVVATSLALMAFDIAAAAMDGSMTLAPDWPARVAGLFAFCIAIGFAEEALFRGLLLGGLLDVLGSGRRGVVWAVVVSSVLFGAVHVEWWSLDYLDPLQLLQALLKTLQTGTYGFYLASLVVRSGDIVGAALLHGIDDFLLLVTTVGLLGQSTDLQYVTTGADAWPTIVLYTVLIVLYLPLVWQGMRMLREVTAPEHGALHTR